MLLLIVGAWVARRERFFLVVASWFAFDMMMHLGFGFGLNEVYIMTAHWAYVMPIAVGYLLVTQPQRRRTTAVATVALTTLWLWIYNAALIVKYLC